MANLLCVSIILLFILDNTCLVTSQTSTLSPTKEPTTEPTSEPTLEPTLHPLFTLISTTINTPIPVPSPSPSDKPSTDFTFIQENYLWIIIGGSALLCICLIVLVFIIRNHVTKKKLKSELQNTNQEITNEALKEEKKPMNVRTIERTSEDNNNNNNNNNNNINDIYSSYNYQQFNMQQLQQL
eukprot:43373_1